VTHMLKTNAIERTEKALSARNGTGNGAAAQGLGLTEQVYCPTHGTVKAVWGQCEECFDAGLQDWDATRVANLLIPAWVGIKTDGRTVIVAPVKDALEAVQTISRYKNSDALVLIAWDGLITALDNGRIGPSWGLQSLNAEAHADDDVQICAICRGLPYVRQSKRSIAAMCKLRAKPELCSPPPH
jgi:hypothetical protein